MKPTDYELIDTHCHLSHPRLADRAERVLADARAATKIVMR